jgi:hypothetical protein
VLAKEGGWITGHGWVICQTLDDVKNWPEPSLVAAGV